jgi:cytochrome P450
MAPPLSAGFPKTVPAGGDVICGKALPAGTDIHMNFMSLMRDQEVFGPDTDVFRPERFIDCDEVTKAKRLKVVDLNFGFGRWQCLGKVLAWMEMNKIFVEVSILNRTRDVQTDFRYAFITNPLHSFSDRLIFKCSTPSSLGADNPPQRFT